jgi:hypothetical protein
VPSPRKRSKLKLRLFSRTIVDGNPGIGR